MTHARLFAWWLLLGTVLFAAPIHADTVTVGIWLPFTGTWPVGPALEPAVLLALEAINNDTTLLPNTSVNHFVIDDLCDPGVGLGALFESVSTYQDFVGIIGAGCSIVSTPLAQIANYWTIPMISYGSTSPALSDKTSYPYFMRTVGPDTKQASAWLNIALFYGWKTVATMSSTEELHFLLTKDFERQAREHGIRVEVSETFGPKATVNELRNSLRTIKQRGVHIIFMAAYRTTARNVMLASALEGTSGVGYAWVGAESWVVPGEPVWLLGNGTITDGNEEIIKQAAQGVVGTLPSPGAGPAYEAFLELYRQRAGFSAEDELNPYISYIYDAAYAFAHGLHEIVEVRGMSYDFPGSIIQVPEKIEFRSDLRSFLFNNTYFEGLTDIVTFDEFGDRLPSYDVVNIRGDDLIGVGHYDTLFNVYTLVAEVVWPGGVTTIPNSDPLAVRDTVWVDYDDPVAIVALVLLMPLIPVCIAIAAYFAFFRKSPIVQDTGLVYHMLLLLGIAISALMIFAYIGEPNDDMCGVRPWTMLVWFFVVGNLVAKQAVIARQVITRDKKESAILRIKYTWYELLIANVAILAFEGLYLILWTAVDYPTRTKESTIESDEDQYVCRSSDSHYAWIGVQAGIAAVLLLVGAVASVIAYFPSVMYREAKFLGLAIVLVIFATIITALGVFLTWEIPSASLVLLAVGIFAHALVILGFVFATKMVQIVRVKKADRRAVKGGVVQPNYKMEDDLDTL